MNLTDPSGLFSKELIMSTFYRSTSWNSLLNNWGKQQDSLGQPYTNWGFLSALLDAEEGDILTIYGIDLHGRIKGRPLLKEIGRYTLGVGSYQGMPSWGMINENNSPLDLTGGGRMGRYYFLSSRQGTKVYIDGTTYTDYPDFLIVNYGITDSIKLMIENLAKKVLIKGVASCLSLSGGTIIDRYGNKYIYVNGGVNPGTSLYTTGLGWVTKDIRNPGHLIMDEESLKNTISGLSVGGNGSLVAGVSVSWTPGSNAGSLIYSAGAQGGIGFEATAIQWTHEKNSSLGWQWAIEQELGGPFAIYQQNLEGR